MKEYNRRPYVIERAKKYHEDRCIKKEIINRICLYCNNVYNPKSKRRKYCCDGCAKNANRLKVDINNKKIVKEKVSLPLKEHSICEYCKNSYTRKTMLQKYCKGCTKKRQREHSKKRYVKISHDGICIECGDVYNPRNANSKYCSLECQSKALNLRRKEKKSVQTTLNNTMSSAIHKSLGCEKAGRHWEDLVGYTLRELTIHLEKEFTDGMTWMNRGKEGWHIDHICPKSAFCFRTTYDVDFKRCWALGNLQPLWWRDNIEKRYSLLGDKRSLCWFE